MQKFIFGLILAALFCASCYFLDEWQKTNKQAVPLWVGFLLIAGVLLLFGGILYRSIAF